VYDRRSYTHPEPPKDRMQRLKSQRNKIKLNIFKDDKLKINEYLNKGRNIKRGNERSTKNQRER
jgi:hypothetical protein